MLTFVSNVIPTGRYSTPLDMGSRISVLSFEAELEQRLDDASSNTTTPTDSESDKTDQSGSEER